MTYLACHILIWQSEYLQGGLKAVIWTDVFQAGVMLVGILIIVVQVSTRIRFK